MNRVFVFLVFTAFLFASAREIAFQLPDAPHTAGWKELAHFTIVDGRALSPMAELQDAVFASAEKAVKTAFDMIGATALFLGLMKIVEHGGGLQIVARLIRPILVRLFPDVPPNHPAMGAMIMNLAANALGLGNAATPLGLKAMVELEKLNPHKGTATDAMALFMTLNTSAITLFATGVIVNRRAAGSEDPAGIQMTTLFASVFAAVLGTLACFALKRYFAPPPATNPIDASDTEEVDAGYPMWVSVAAIGGFLAVFMLALPAVAIGWPGAIEVGTPWLVPMLIVGFLGFGWVRGVPVYEVLVSGAKEGFEVVVRVIPYLVAVLVAVGMFRASGALRFFGAILGPLTSKVGLPAEALPMVLIRPLSGSGAQGVLIETINNPATGPDTYVGYLVSTIQGSTETTFYVLSVYFGAVGIQRIRHALPAALFAELCGFIGAILAVQAYFYFVLGRAP